MACFPELNGILQRFQLSPLAKNLLFSAIISNLPFLFNILPFFFSSGKVRKCFPCFTISPFSTILSRFFWYAPTPPPPPPPAPKSLCLNSVLKAAALPLPKDGVRQTQTADLQTRKLADRQTCRLAFPN